MGALSAVQLLHVHSEPAPATAAAVPPPARDALQTAQVGEAGGFMKVHAEQGQGASTDGGASAAVPAGRPPFDEAGCRGLTLPGLPCRMRLRSDSSSTSFSTAAASAAIAASSDASVALSKLKSPRSTCGR